MDLCASRSAPRAESAGRMRKVGESAAGSSDLLITVEFLHASILRLLHSVGGMVTRHSCGSPTLNKITERSTKVQSVGTDR